VGVLVGEEPSSFLRGWYAADGDKVNAPQERLIANFQGRRQFVFDEVRAN
jgi:hypothetical protein